MLGWVVTATALCSCTGVDSTYVGPPAFEPGPLLPPSEPPPSPPPQLTPVEGDDCTMEAVWPAFGARDVDVTVQPELYLREPVALEELRERLRFTRLDDGSAVAFDLELADPLRARVLPRSALGFWQSYSLALETSEVGCNGISGVFSTVAPELLPPPLRTAAALKLARKGNTVYSTAPTFHGLQVHRLSGTQLQLLGDVHWPESSNAIVLLDDRGYVPAGAGGVVILDVSQAEAPRVIGRAGVPGSAADVAAFRSAGRELLAVAAGAAGIVIVDVTEPEVTDILAEVALSGTGIVSTRDVELEGELLAVAAGENGTYTLDLTDPAQPVVLGHTPDATAREVRLSGGVAYTLFDGWPRIRSYDARQPGAALGEWGTCGVPCGLFSESVQLFDDDLYVATSQGGVIRVAASAQGSLLETNQPRLRARSAVASVLASSDVTLIGEVGGPAVFSPDGSGPHSFDPNGHGDASGIAIRGRFAYVAASFAGLQTFDLSDPLRPRWVGRVDSPGMTSAHDIAATAASVREDLLILSDGRAGMSLYRLTDPEQPALAATTSESIDRLGDVAWVGSRAYACNDNTGIELFEVADPTAPGHQPALRFPSGEVHACRSLRAHPREPLLYMSDLRSLVVYGVADGGEVSRIAEVQLPSTGSMGTLALAGERLIAAMSARDFAPGSPGGVSPRLQLFDLSDPRAPLAVWRSEPLDGSITTLTVTGQKLFAGGGTTVRIFDLSGIEPELEGTVQTQSAIRQLLATPDAVYVAQSTGGFAVLRTGELPASDGAASLPPPVLR